VRRSGLAGFKYWNFESIGMQKVDMVLQITIQGITHEVGMQLSGNPPPLCYCLDLTVLTLPSVGSTVPETAPQHLPHRSPITPHTRHTLLEGHDHGSTTQPDNPVIQQWHPEWQFASGVLHFSRQCLSYQRSHCKRGCVHFE
jgi:hypothetical protein